MSFKIVCNFCGSDRGFIEVADVIEEKGEKFNYSILACKDCQNQQEYFPANDLGIKYQYLTKEGRMK